MDIAVGTGVALKLIIGGAFPWVDKKTYIVHIYKDKNRGVDVFEKRPEGTPLAFINPSPSMSGSPSDDDCNVPESYVLPALYGIDKKGKERIWKIWVINDTVYKSYGETTGIRVPSSRIFKGVNIGKKNATTAEEQAKREAERDWVKQLDKQYLPKTDEGIELANRVLAAKKRQGGVNVNIDELIRGRTDANGGLEGEGEGEEGDDEVGGEELLPMHCQVWSTEAKCLKYFDFDAGVYIQPKLDGVRCLAKIKNGKVILTTRQGKSIVWLDHIRREILTFLRNHEDIQLDCEVYASRIYGKAEPYETKKGYAYIAPDEKGKIAGKKAPELVKEQRFDVISGAVRPKRTVPHVLESQLCLYVFDIADPTGELDQDQRFKILDMLFSRPVAKKIKHIKRVDTKLIYSSDEIEEYHDEVARDDYEGVVIRARNLYYESKRRSLSMRKHKHFEDSEYVIVGYELDPGVGDENFLWVCETIDQTATFPVKPMGTREQRIEWYQNGDDYIGRILTVRYQTITYEGVPRFPRGIHIRDYE